MWGISKSKRLTCQSELDTAALIGLGLLFQVQLPKSNIQPAPELVAYFTEVGYLFKSQFLVQSHTDRVGQGDPAQNNVDIQIL